MALSRQPKRRGNDRRSFRRRAFPHKLLAIVIAMALAGVGSLSGPYGPVVDRVLAIFCRDLSTATLLHERRTHESTSK